MQSEAAAQVTFPCSAHSFFCHLPIATFNLKASGEANLLPYSHNTFEARMLALEVTVPRLHEQMEKSMQMVDRLADTSFASLGQPTKPKTRSRK